MPGYAVCPRFYTRVDDGLTQSWQGHVVFMNLPYGREIGRWVDKAAREGAAGAIVVGLLPARTDTGWWHTSPSAVVTPLTTRTAGLRVGVSPQSCNSGIPHWERSSRNRLWVSCSCAASIERPRGPMLFTGWPTVRAPILRPAWAPRIGAAFMLPS
jgi:hypothetical protein